MVQGLICFLFIFRGGFLLSKTVPFSSYSANMADNRFLLQPELLQAAR